MKKILIISIITMVMVFGAIIGSRAIQMQENIMAKQNTILNAIQ